MSGTPTGTFAGRCRVKIDVHPERTDLDPGSPRVSVPLKGGGGPSETINSGCPLSCPPYFCQ